MTRRLHQLDALLRCVTKRLFDVNILPGGQSIKHHLSVPVLRSRNDDDIDILSVQEFLMSSISFRLALGHRETRLEIRLINVAHGSQLGGLVLRKALHQESPTSA